MIRVLAFISLIFLLDMINQDANAQQNASIDSTLYWQKSDLLDATAVQLARQEIKMEEGREILNSLADYFGKVNATDRLAYTFTLHGTSFHRQNKLDSADFYHSKANDVLDNNTSTNMRLVNMVRSTYAAMLAGKNEYNKSAEYFLKSLNFLKSNNLDNQNNEYIAKTYNNVATVYKSINDNEQSLRYYDSCLVILRKDKVEMNSMLGEMVHSNIALIYSILGIHDQAIEHLKQSETIRNNIPDQYSHIMDRFPLDLIFANVYSSRKKDQGDGQIALQYLKRNYDQFQKEYPLDPKLLEYYNEFTSAYFVVGNYDSALYFTKKAEKFQLEAYGEDRPNLADTYLKYSKIYKALGNQTLEQDYRDKAIRQFEKPNNIIRDSYGLLLFDQAEFELKKNNPKGAEAQIQKATKAFLGIEGKPVLYNPPFQELSGKDFLIDFFSRKGRVLAKLYSLNNDKKYLEGALESYLLSIRQSLKTKKGIYGLRSKSNIYSSNYDLVQETILISNQLFDISGDNKYLDKSILLSDFSKTLAIREAFYTAKLDVTGVPEDLLELEYSLRSKLLEFEVVGYGQPEPNEDKLPEEFYLVDKSNEAYFQTKSDLESLISTYKKDHPNYYSLKYGNIYDTENELIPAKLPLSVSNSNHLLIQFQDFGTEYYAFYTHRGKTNYLKIPKTSQLKSDIEILLVSIKEKNNDFISPSFRIYSTLLDPVLKNIDVEKIIIIPDGELALIPFEVLISEPPMTEQNLKNLPYLIKKHQISYHYSAFLLKNTKSPTKSGKKVNFLGIAPSYAGISENTNGKSTEITRESFASLPNNAAEVNEISVGFNSTILLASDAQESKFKEYASAADIIHLATHSQINNSNPLLSSLVLMENELDDGYLHSYELFNLKLNANLVILSACNSGTGEYQKGEGIISIGRAFMYANVSNLLMSLWAIPDLSTKKLMTGFYEKIKKGEPYEAAIREAKLDYLVQADENTAHPYYWAAFIYVGDVEAEKSNYLRYSFIAVLLIIAFIFAYRRFFMKATKI
ncbi:CHAT domain-containing protein [Belliella sp. R4-6]|uniref:CHAT domain-containing protein n=1 Tax=Belliella alkalica TaxID=1730871 RepID=A0ABS9V7S9_9BACT|nr:CHAT domain-containing tetratricopeptide repeat protein [Belliella alkalica]MCH7412459.1 CHAT domain-containing protein [Belliella alkalica]